MGKTICANCIGVTYLSTHIANTCQVGECDFCLGTAKAISLENLSVLIDRHLTGTIKWSLNNRRTTTSQAKTQLQQS